MKCSSGALVNMQARAQDHGAGALGKVALGERSQQRLVLGQESARGRSSRVDGFVQVVVSPELEARTPQIGKP